MSMNPDDTHTYRTLEEIRQRKEELRLQIDRDNRKLETLWSRLFTKREESTKGEFIANIISHRAFAIDTFLMVRKLRRNYNGVLSFFSRKKSK